VKNKKKKMDIERYFDGELKREFSPVFVKGKLIKASSEKELHQSRMRYCWLLCFKELESLGLKNINNILKKYSVSTNYNTLTAFFPKGLRERDLPKELRLRR